MGRIFPGLTVLFLVKKLSVENCGLIDNKGLRGAWKKGQNGCKIVKVFGKWCPAVGRKY
jgi:hypothetical protein